MGLTAWEGSRVRKADVIVAKNYLNADEVDRLLSFNDKPILQGSGKLSNESAWQIAHDRYDSFDNQRRQAEPLVADAEDLKVLEAVAKKGSSTS
jgi:hypothetical protein